MNYADLVSAPAKQVPHAFRANVTTEEFVTLVARIAELEAALRAFYNAALEDLAEADTDPNAPVTKTHVPVELVETARAVLAKGQP